MEDRDNPGVAVDFGPSPSDQRELGCRGHISGAFSLSSMTEQYLNHQLECPYCLTIRLRIPAGAGPEDRIVCDDCGEFLGTWDDLLTDFEKQGGQDGVFRLDKGRIRRID